MGERQGEQEREQRKSSIDRVNDLIDNARHARNAGKNLRRGYNATKAARTGATVLRTGGTAVEGAEALGAGVTAGGIGGGTILLIILLIILIVILGSLILTVFTGSPTTIGSQTLCSDAGGICQAGLTCPTGSSKDDSGAVCSEDPTRPLCCVPVTTTTPGNNFTCSSGNYAECLKRDFNIVITGPASSTIIKKIYLAYAFMGKSSKYIDLLTNGGTYYIRDVRASGCHGYATSENVLTLYDGTCSSLPQAAITYLLVHEGGHIMSKRNPRLYQNFPYYSLSQSDSRCFQSSTCGGSSGYFLKSYPLRYYCPGWGSGCIGKITSRSESFAESIADYYSRDSYWRTGWANLCAISLNDFKSTCDNTFNWLKTNVFGGYTYY